MLRVWGLKFGVMVLVRPWGMESPRPDSLTPALSPANTAYGFSVNGLEFFGLGSRMLGSGFII